MLFMTIGKIAPENMEEAYTRFKVGQDVPAAIKIQNRVFEADGHRFFVIHDCNDATAMASYTRGWEDICEFETVPVINDQQLVKTFD